MISVIDLRIYVQFMQHANKAKLTKMSLAFFCQSMSELLYGCPVRGPLTILKEFWTKEVDIPEVETSYEYITELRELWRIH